MTLETRYKPKLRNRYRQVYVQARDEELWRLAIKFAQRHHASLAAVVTEALRQYLQPGFGDHHSKDTQ